MISIIFTFDSRDEAMTVHSYLISSINTEEISDSVMIGPSRHGPKHKKYYIPIYIGSDKSKATYKITIPWKFISHVIYTRKTGKKNVKKFQNNW